MQERKRMERLIAEDVSIATQTDDLDTLFELSREGENVTSDLERELKNFYRVARPRRNRHAAFR